MFGEERLYFIIGDDALFNFGLAVGDLTGDLEGDDLRPGETLPGDGVRPGELVLLADVMRIGEICPFELRFGELLGDNAKASRLVLPDFKMPVWDFHGLEGSPQEPQVFFGLPNGDTMGLRAGVPGVRVSELMAELSAPVSVSDDEASIEVHGGGRRRFSKSLLSHVSVEDSPGSWSEMTTPDEEESSVVMRGSSVSLSVSQRAMGAILGRGGVRYDCSSVWLSSLSVESVRSTETGHEQQKH